MVASLLIVPSYSGALVGPDAGTGVDAGGSTDSAMTLPSWGSYDGALTYKDADLYQVASASSVARCVSLDLSAATTGIVALASSRGDQVRGIGQGIVDGGAHLGLATTSSDATWVYTKRTGSDSSLQSYDFTVSAMPLPDAVSGDGGAATDAGSTLASSTVAEGSCIGGNIGTRFGFADTTDVYSIPAPAPGQYLFYSFATPDPAARLSVLDAAGDPVGSAIASGGVAAISAQSPAYYLQVSSTSAAAQPYLIGITGGPDPGSGCRPMCLM